MTVIKINKNGIKISDDLIRLKVATKIEVKESPGKGLGVFATEKIYTREIIEECHLLTLPITKGESTSLLIDYRFNYPQGDDWNEQVVALGYGSIYNHSDKPNVTWETHPKYKAFQFIATRDIEVGEELCTYYGSDSYWNDGRSNIEIK